jgi:hypothetical protein
MARLSKIILSFVISAGAVMAGDYDALLGAIRKSWPSCGHLAVVCDSTSSRSAITAISGASGGMKLLVVDVRGPQDMGKAISTLSGQKPDVVILVAGDHVVGDGSSAATFLIKRMADLKVPTAATTEAGVRQGAALGIGPGTGGKLLSNAKVAAVAGIQVPSGATSI